MTFRDYRKPGDIPVSNIAKEVLIPVEAYRPLFKPSYSLASVVTGNHFLKTHSLQSYNWLADSEDKSDICQTILRELDICEQLRKHPHLNLANYIGCQVIEGRISGLCFERYTQTLQEVFNPKGYQKRATQTLAWSDEQIAQYLDPIESAVRHLHSLGIVHNDIKPANIMFDQDQNPVLIDFGSCCKLGQSLEGIGRTYEWHIENLNVAQPSNDLDAIREIREWLSKRNPKKNLFAE